MSLTDEQIDRWNALIVDETLSDVDRWNEMMQINPLRLILKDGTRIRATDAVPADEVGVELSLHFVIDSDETPSSYLMKINE